MKNRQTYIQIAGDRLVLAMPGPDGALRHADAPITLSQEPGQWSKELLRLSDTLRELARKLGVDGAEAIVLYAGPTQAVTLESLPIRSTAQAIEAAKLSCMEKVNYPTVAAVCEAMPIGRNGAGADVARRTHVAVAVDRDDVLGAIARFVEESGLRFVSAIPIDAPLMAQLAEQGLSDTESQARLYVGEHSSLFFISGNRSLLFARRIGLGVESMVNVLTHPIRARSGEEPVTLSVDQAREILNNHGVPDRDVIVHDEPELRGMQIIPVLQPVLQRIVVELRQSLRFSLPEGSAGTVPVHCLGPGSRIPGLAHVIEAELEMSLAAETEQQQSRAPEADTERLPILGVGSVMMLADAVRNRRILRDFALLPTDHTRMRQRMHLQRWLWAGAAAALFMVAVDGFRYHATVQLLSSQKAAMLSHHSELDTFHRTSAVLAGALAEMSHIERRVDAELQHHFDSRAALNELSYLTPDSIQLTAITFRRFEQGMTGTLSGIALHDADQQTDLKRYVEQIRSSPLFVDAVLGNVQASSEHERMGEQFEASLSLTPLPRPDQADSDLRPAAYAAQPTGGEP